MQVHLPGPSIERIGYKSGHRVFWTGKKLQCQRIVANQILANHLDFLPIKIVVKLLYGRLDFRAFQFGQRTFPPIFQVKLKYARE
jgi:hypothetical protein